MVEELLRDERFDGRRVVGALVLANGEVAQAECDHRLARARGRAEDDVVAGGEVKQGLLLMGPELEAAAHAPVEVALEGLVCGEGSLGLIVWPLLGVKPHVRNELAERARSERVLLVRLSRFICHGASFELRLYSRALSYRTRSSRLGVMGR